MRWGITALLFAATTVNYIDRQTLSVVAPYIRGDLSVTNVYAKRSGFWLVPW